jgi:hypothetical protein
MRRHVLATAVATLLALPACAAWAADTTRAASPYLSNTILRLDDGRKWATDEPLRRYMGEIRDMLALQRSTLVTGRLMPEEAALIGAAIEARVAAILTHCRLAPQAAHNLHLVVADLVQAADILQGRARGSPMQGAAKAMRAAQMYATYFDHPEWKPVL